MWLDFTEIQDNSWFLHINVMWLARVLAFLSIKCKKGIFQGYT